MMKDYDYADYPELEQTTPASPAEPVDWDTIAEIVPPLFSLICWALWALFLLIPSAFGLHYAALFSTANNVVFVLMGFVLCIAISTAIKAGHGMRAVFFGLGIFLLSFWF